MGNPIFQRMKPTTPDLFASLPFNLAGEILPPEPVAVAEVAKEETAEMFPKPRGMSVEESRQYLRDRQKESVFGYSWESIQRAQRGGRLTR
jgi:hypothetical protein